jgi:hypothetical protein
LFNPQGHALAVDVGDLQGHNFADPQASRIGQRQGGLVFQVAGRRDQALHLVWAQDHR